MSTRYLLINKEMGVFLGTYLKYVLFAKSDAEEIVKAYSFSDEESAREFAKIGTEMSQEDYFIAPIQANDKYVHVVDLIKAGYGDHVYNLMNNIEMVSYEVH
jgi:predicted Co/Zn/Cd cation transporter (cation efflux family)